MKIKNITLALFVLLAITSCKKNSSDDDIKKDSTKPTISLNGAASMDIPYGVNTPDPGATANDETDGNISDKISSDWSSKINSNSAGTYVVTYKVSDKSGNEASVIRNVTVKYGASSFFGEYNTTFTNSGTTSVVFTSTLSAGDNANQFVIYPFRGGNIYLKVNMSGLMGNQLSFSQVDFGNTTTGTGIIENSGNTINLTYTVYTSIGDFPQTATYTRK